MPRWLLAVALTLPDDRRMHPVDELLRTGRRADRGHGSGGDGRIS